MAHTIVTHPRLSVPFFADFRFFSPQFADSPCNRPHIVYYQARFHDLWIIRHRRGIPAAPGEARHRGEHDLSVRHIFAPGPVRLGRV